MGKSCVWSEFSFIMMSSALGCGSKCDAGSTAYCRTCRLVGHPPGGISAVLGAPAGRRDGGQRLRLQRHPDRFPAWDLLKANRIPAKGYTHILYDKSLRVPGMGLVADPENLPSDAQSVDLLVLPHILECSANPHRILREAERVLVPEGRIVISGFNPWSLWGARERIPGLDPLLPVPAHLQVSLARLKDWFKLLSFEVDRGRFGCYEIGRAQV